MLLVGVYRCLWWENVLIPLPLWIKVSIWALYSHDRRVQHVSNYISQPFLIFAVLADTAVFVFVHTNNLIISRSDKYKARQCFGGLYSIVYLLSDFFCPISLNMHQKGHGVQWMQMGVSLNKQTPKLFWDDSKIAFVSLRPTRSDRDCIKVLCEFVRAKTINTDSVSPFSFCFVALIRDFLLATPNPYRHQPDYQTHHINFIIGFLGKSGYCEPCKHFNQTIALIWLFTVIRLDWSCLHTERSQFDESWQIWG